MITACEKIKPPGGTGKIKSMGRTKEIGSGIRYFSQCKAEIADFTVKDTDY